MKIRAINGQMMKCIEYIGNRDITIQFDDGTIVYHQTVGQFTKGTVRNPNRPHPLLKKEKRKNAVFTLKNGETATVIDYKTADDVTVKLSNGSILKTNWYALEHGKAIGTQYESRTRHFGEQYQTKYGIYCKITGLTEQSYQITWEDGNTSNSELNNIINGTSKHPMLKRDKKITFAYHNYMCKFIYNDDSDYYYICSCPKCGYDNILTAKEMLKPHKCNLKQMIKGE